MRAIGLGHEIVDHAIGQLLEAEGKREAGERIGDLEIQISETLHPSAPSGSKVHRPVEEANGPSTKRMAMECGRSSALRVTKCCVRPAKRRSRRATSWLPSRSRTRAPVHQEKRSRVCFHIVDQIEHLFRRVAHQGLAVNVRQIDSPIVIPDMGSRDP